MYSGLLPNLNSGVSDRRQAGQDRRERGASAVSYGLTLALFVLAMVGAIDLIRDRSSDLLVDSGNNIAEPRDPAEIAIKREGKPLPEGVNPPLEPTITTFLNVPVKSASGCLSAAPDGTVTSGSCDGSATLFSILSDDGAKLSIEFGGNKCLQAGEPVGVGPCGQSETLWSEVVDVSGGRAYENTATGTCLQMTDNLLTTGTCSVGGDLTTDPNQIFQMG